MPGLSRSTSAASAATRLVATSAAFEGGIDSVNFGVSYTDEAFHRGISSSPLSPLSLVDDVPNAVSSNAALTKNTKSKSANAGGGVWSSYDTKDVSVYDDDSDEDYDSDTLGANKNIDEAQIGLRRFASKSYSSSSSSDGGQVLSASSISSGGGGGGGGGGAVINTLAVPVVAIRAFNSMPTIRSPTNNSLLTNATTTSVSMMRLPSTIQPSTALSMSTINDILLVDNKDESEDEPLGISTDSDDDIALEFKPVTSIISATTSLASRSSSNASEGVIQKQRQRSSASTSSAASSSSTFVASAAASGIASVVPPTPPQSLGGGPSSGTTIAKLKGVMRANWVLSSSSSSSSSSSANLIPQSSSTSTLVSTATSAISTASGLLQPQQPQYHSTSPSLASSSSFLALPTPPSSFPPQATASIPISLHVQQAKSFSNNIASLDLPSSSPPLLPPPQSNVIPVVQAQSQTFSSNSPPAAVIFPPPLPPHSQATLVNTQQTIPLQPLPPQTQPMSEAGLSPSRRVGGLSRQLSQSGVSFFGTQVVSSPDRTSSSGGGGGGGGGGTISSEQLDIDAEMDTTNNTSAGGVASSIVSARRAASKILNRSFSAPSSSVLASLSGPIPSSTDGFVGGAGGGGGGLFTSSSIPLSSYPSSSSQHLLQREAVEIRYVERNQQQQQQQQNQQLYDLNSSSISASANALAALPPPHSSSSQSTQLASTTTMMMMMKNKKSSLSVAPVSSIATGRVMLLATSAKGSSQSNTSDKNKWGTPAGSVLPMRASAPATAPISGRLIISSSLTTRGEPSPHDFEQQLTVFHEKQVYHGIAKVNSHWDPQDPVSVLCGFDQKHDANKGPREVLLQGASWDEIISAFLRAAEEAGLTSEHLTALVDASSALLPLPLMSLRANGGIFMASIRKVTLSSCALTVDQVRSLPQMRNLRYLDLSDNDLLCELGVDLLVTRAAKKTETEETRSSVSGGGNDSLSSGVLPPNRLPSLPRWLDFCPSLRVLSLRGCCLKSPPSLLSVPLLESLDLSCNKISLPAGLESASGSLRSLDIRFNELSTISRGIRPLAVLRSLSTLDLHPNPVTLSLSPREVRSTVCAMLPQLLFLDTFATPKTAVQATMSLERAPGEAGSKARKKAKIAIKSAMSSNQASISQATHLPYNAASQLLAEAVHAALVASSTGVDGNEDEEDDEVKEHSVKEHSEVDGTGMTPRSPRAGSFTSPTTVASSSKMFRSRKSRPSLTRQQPASSSSSSSIDTGRDVGVSQSTNHQDPHEHQMRESLEEKKKEEEKDKTLQKSNRSVANARHIQQKKMELLSTPPPSRKKPSVRMSSSEVTDAIDVSKVKEKEEKEEDYASSLRAEAITFKKVDASRATSLAWSAAAESLTSVVSSTVKSPLGLITTSSDNRVHGVVRDQNDEEEDDHNNHEEDGDPEEEEAERVEATAVWLQCARTKTLALLSGLKTLMNMRAVGRQQSNISANIERVIAQLIELCAFSTVFNSNMSPTSPPPSFGQRRRGGGEGGSNGLNNIKLEAKKWLEDHSHLLLSGLQGIDQLSREERAAVVTAVSQVATATVALDIYVSLLSPSSSKSSLSSNKASSPSSPLRSGSFEPFTEEDEAIFKKELVMSAVGPLCKFLGSIEIKNDKTHPVLPVLM